MTRFEHDSVVPLNDSALSKKEQVAEMFDDIAKKYDFLNRFLSAGTDVTWRKKALSHLKEIKPSSLLDVATGTADVAILAHRILSPNKIVGIDISEGMLEIGRKKIKDIGLDEKISLIKGDSESIEFPDNSFDAVSVAFGVRNFQDLEKGLTEIKRVLKPGGMAILQIPQDLNREQTFADDTITDQKERAKLFGQYDHVRVYGRDYFDKLRSIGFRVVEEDYTHKIAPQLVEKYCLAKGEIIPVCFK